MSRSSKSIKYETQAEREFGFGFNNTNESSPIFNAFGTVFPTPSMPLSLPNANPFESMQFPAPSSEQVLEMSRFQSGDIHQEDNTEASIVSHVFTTSVDKNVGSSFTFKYTPVFQDVTGKSSSENTGKLDLNSLVSINAKLAQYESKNPRVSNDPIEIGAEFPFMGICAEDVGGMYTASDIWIDWSRDGIKRVTSVISGNVSCRNLWVGAKTGNRVGFAITKKKCRHFVLSPDRTFTLEKEVYAYQFVPVILYGNCLPDHIALYEDGNSFRPSAFVNVGIIVDSDESESRYQSGPNRIETDYTVQQTQGLVRIAVSSATHPTF